MERERPSLSFLYFITFISPMFWFGGERFISAEQQTPKLSQTTVIYLFILSLHFLPFPLDM